MQVSERKLLILLLPSSGPNPKIIFVHVNVLIALFTLCIIVVGMYICKYVLNQEEEISSL